MCGNFGVFYNIRLCHLGTKIIYFSDSQAFYFSSPFSLAVTFHNTMLIKSAKSEPLWLVYDLKESCQSFPIVHGVSCGIYGHIPLSTQCSKVSHFLHIFQLWVSVCSYLLQEEAYLSIVECYFIALYSSIRTVVNSIWFSPI